MDGKIIEDYELVSQLINKSEFIELPSKNTFPKQPREIEIGNREYKINLNFSKFKRKKNITNILNKKATQMTYRLIEGGGMAVYFIGVADNGDVLGISINELIISLLYFSKIVSISDSSFKKIRIYKGLNGYIATIRVYKEIDSFDLNLNLEL